MVHRGRSDAPALLIKSGNQPLPHCRERESGDLLISISVECVAGLHVPLVKEIRFVHPIPCQSKVKPRPMV